MSKKKATSEPVVAEEPARPEEQIRFDQSQVAPPSTRRTTSERRSSSAAPKSYVARTASERRAARGTRTAAGTRAGHRHGEALSPQVVMELLEHPTIEVSEADLRRDYGYVIADLRSMGLLSLGLIVTLAVLATVLPK